MVVGTIFDDGNLEMDCVLAPKWQPKKCRLRND